MCFSFHDVHDIVVKIKEEDEHYPTECIVLSTTMCKRNYAYQVAIQ